MGENGLADEDSANPCSTTENTWEKMYMKLKGRYAKSEQGRSALKQALKIMDSQLSKVQTENLVLKKASQDEKARADFEREQKEKESAMRATLENELDALKLECQMLQENDGSFSKNSNVEVQLLEERIVEGEKEINLLKELIEKEKLRADAEKKRADAETTKAESDVKKANDALKKVMEEKKVNELERRNNDDNRVQLEALKSELSQVKLKLDETVKQHEIERLKADSELKRAESERKKVEEALNKLKEEKRDVNDDNKNSEEYRVQLEVLKAEIVEVKSNFEETKKQLDIEKSRADEEKKRADAERKRAESNVKKANDALKKVKEEKKLIEVERRNNDANRVQLEALKSELSRVKLKLEENVKELEIERLKADSELKRAESERKKLVEELKKVMEDKRDVNDDNKRSEEYGVQLEVLKAEIAQVKSNFEETKKQLDIEKTRADTERKRADAEKKRVESVRKKANEAEKKVKEDKRLADLERKSSEESRVQLDVQMSLLSTDLEETKKQLEKEKTRANTEKKRADAEKNRSDTERKKANEAEKKIKEGIRLADVERKKSEESRVQLEALKTELIQVKSVLEETKKQLEKQKMRADSEKKRAESERKKASETVKTMREDCRLTDAEKRMSKEKISQLEVLKTGTVELNENTEENNLPQKIGSGKSKKRKRCGDSKKSDQQKSGYVYKQSTEENYLLEQLQQEVDNNKGRIQEMQSLIDNLLSSKNLSTSPLSIQNSESESSKIKLLRKKLKFEKTLVKHAKEVAELEVARNNILQGELGRLKQEFLKFSEHLNILGNPAFKSDAGISCHGKLCRLPLKRKHSHEQPHPINLCSSQEFTRPCSTSNASNSKYCVKCSAPFLPLHEECSCETISGINSKLECLPRGLNQKMLQISAMNSCSASFSDRSLVGSQEDGAFPVTTSANPAKQNLNSEQFSARLTDDLTTRFIHSNPLPIQKNNGDDNGNKQSPGAVESIRNLCYEGHTTCRPHNYSDLCFPEKGSLVPIVQGECCNEDIIPSKRRKKISEEHMAPEFAFKTSSTESNLCKQAPASRPIPAVSFETSKDGINDLLPNPEISGNCNGLDLCNIMKLFDLDNEEDERSYCAAMERPLSPILPMLELPNHNTADASKSKDSQDNFHVGRSTVLNDAAKCGSFDVIEVEIDSNKKSKSCGRNCTSQIEKPDGFVFSISNSEGSEKADNEQITDLRFRKNSELSPQMSDIVTIRRESLGSCKPDVSLTCSTLPRYLIVHPDIKDAASISSICGAIRRYMSHCTMTSSCNYVKDILMVLARDEGLSSMEKVCTFVTIMLQKINEDVMMNSGTSMGIDICQFIDTFSYNLKTVLSDIKMHMMDLWDLSDLLNVIEDFLTNRRALPFGDASSDMIKSATLDENGGILYGQEAPISLVVAGGALLATICASVDDVGFVCEVSCYILRTQKSNSSLVLIILHVFAHICGPKYFGEEYGLVVNVIRSLVVYLEKLNSSDTIASGFPLTVEGPYNPWPCCNCPFLHDSSSTDVVVSLLLKDLRGFIMKSTGRLDHLDPINQAKSCAKMYEVDYLNCAQVMGCDNVDLFSLLELVACCMSWNWSFENIVCPVLEMLESCAMESFSAAVITFLGQLGRIGVEAHGYDDAKVENLRNRFSAFLTRSAMGNSEYLVQLASATALSGLTPLSFKELVDSDSTIPETAVSLKNWFFSLSNEQQASCKMELFSCPRE